MTLTFDLLTPRSTVHALVLRKDLCQFALKTVHSLSQYSIHKLVTDELTNRQTDTPPIRCLCVDFVRITNCFLRLRVQLSAKRTDRRTKGQTDGQRDRSTTLCLWLVYNQTVFSPTVLRFVCFYDATCILSMIANFLVPISLGEVRAVKGVRGKVGEERGGYRELGNGNGQKMAPKRNIFGIWRCQLEATAIYHTFLGSSFHEQNLPCTCR